MHFNVNFIRHLSKIYELLNDAPWRFNFQTMSKYFRRIHIFSPAFQRLLPRSVQISAIERILFPPSE